jgi:hypothetical protein
VKTKRRHPVPPSKPTYPVDLTHEEMREIKWALRDRLRAVDYTNLRDTVSALAVIQWASEGRQ